MNVEEEIVRLSYAVDEFAAAMKERLAEKARVGYEGWDGAHDADDLRSQIVEDAELMDFEGEDEVTIDIANRCMFLWWRQQRGGV